MNRHLFFYCSRGCWRFCAGRKLPRWTEERWLVECILQDALMNRISAIVLKVVRGGFNGCDYTWFGGRMIRYGFVQEAYDEV
ncbi:MAG: hypothetical protein LBC19_07330 [Tannerella sp.]|nr:hypothetical protein [Tannerella sp.]